VNFNTGEVIAENISLPINENKITTPILIKLLAQVMSPEVFWADLLNRR
jgi:hypothetical protein